MTGQGVLCVTNEELVAAVQAGDDSMMTTLWEQVVRFVAWHASHWACTWEGYAGVTCEDLCQVGYFALVDAVQTYDPEQGARFTTWLAVYLKREFIKALGRRTSRQSSEPLNHACSLDAPTKSADGDGKAIALADTIADSISPYDEAEREIYCGQLREALSNELDNLPTDQRETLERRYYHEQTLEDVASQMETHRSTAQQREKTALRQLRRSTKLAQFIDAQTDFYLHIGVRRYHDTSTSAVESLVLRRERLRAREQITQNDWEVMPYELD